MAKVLVSEDNLTAIADAIRSKNGSTTTYKPGEMAAAINDITTGSGAGDDGYSEDEIKKLMNKNITTFKIPEGVTKIGSYFFSNCNSLTSIQIPEGITEIGEQCFYYNEALTTINLPDSLTTIGYAAFFGCSSMVITKLPDNLASINNRGFTNCYGLNITELPASLTEIKGEVFASTGITDIKIHANIKSIDFYAFAWSPSLTTITFEGTPDSIDSSIFQSDSSLTTINVPWAEGAVSGAPWGATNATINYNYVGGDE